MDIWTSVQKLYVYCHYEHIVENVSHTDFLLKKTKSLTHKPMLLLKESLNPKSMLSVKGSLHKKKNLTNVTIGGEVPPTKCYNF